MSIPTASDFFNQFDFRVGLILDLRRSDHYRERHIQGALNKDLMRSGFMEYIAQLDYSQPIFLYCTDGSRSLAAIRMMKEMGFTQLFHLKDGIRSWDGPISHSK